jgi:thiol-disulfide isomerase/thioredoxin/uncharacterized membrane protein
MSQKRLSSFFPWVFSLLLISLLTGLTLSVISFLEICTTECSEAHQYHFFTIPLSYIGIAFFLITISVHLLSLKYHTLKLLTAWMVAGGFGAEAMLVIIQKYVIGKWCPICLAIAASLAFGALILLSAYLFELHLFITKNKKLRAKKALLNGCFALSSFTIGFLLTFSGVSKEDKELKEQLVLEETLLFGEKLSPVTVYIFTDWQCPACRKAEPQLEKMFPKITKTARVVFVDHPVHTESLNFIPYNLSFIIKNKEHYVSLRHSLTNLSTTTATPTEEDIEKVVKEAGCSYDKLNYSDIILGIKTFKRLVQELKIQGTPTVVVVNRQNKTQKKLTGFGAITEENVLSAIDELKN